MLLEKFLSYFKVFFFSYHTLPIHFTYKVKQATNLAFSQYHLLNKYLKYIPRCASKWEQLIKTFYTSFELTKYRNDFCIKYENTNWLSTNYNKNGNNNNNLSEY